MHCNRRIKESLTTAHVSPSLDHHQDDHMNTLIFPEGGTRAWFVVAGTFVAMFCTFGYIAFPARLDLGVSDRIVWVSFQQIYPLSHKPGTSKCYTFLPGSPPEGSVPISTGNIGVFR